MRLMAVVCGWCAHRHAAWYFLKPVINVEYPYLVALNPSVFSYLRFMKRE